MYLYMSVRNVIMEKQMIKLANKYGVLKMDLENKFVVKKEKKKEPLLSNSWEALRREWYEC